jgi:hypothetical protein
VFDTEMDAKVFARARFDEGLVVFAGTVGPCQPKRLVPSNSILSWLEGAQEQDTARPEGAQK